MTPEQIKQIRTSLGLSQTAFANQMGLSRATVAKWEAGDVEPMGLSVKALEAMKRKAERAKKRTGNHHKNGIYMIQCFTNLQT